MTLPVWHRDVARRLATTPKPRARVKVLGRARGYGAPLLWADPPFDVVARVCREARASVRWTGGDNDTLGRQRWLRMVMAASDRMLEQAGFYTEGV